MLCFFALIESLKVRVTLETSVEEKQHAAVIKETAEDIPQSSLAELSGCWNRGISPLSLPFYLPLSCVRVSLWSTVPASVISAPPQ